MINFQIAEGLPADDIVIFQERLRSAAEKALQLTHSAPDCEISLVMVGNEQIRELNRQYLGIDTPTDVLSFPAGDINPESGNIFLGDILIAFPYVQVQAEAANHGLGDELQVLMVHGILHLLGYDHGEEAERIRMWKMQAEILKAIGCPNDVIPG
jgi:probable rRNA maturation factor